MNDGKLQTPYGIFSGITTNEYYPDGKIKGIRLDDKNVILTHAGELIPFYGEDSPRRKYKSTVTFHKNGMIKAVSLEEQQEVLTPIGELPAELVTFYDTGELKRVFPLDGKISGFWSEEDERALNIPLTFEFDFTSFTALISGICFYKSGDIKSLTLDSTERVEIRAGNIGPIAVRYGFSLYESGALETLEPAEPVKVMTPVGVLTAFDPNASGINADANSLTFDEQGRVTGLVTSDRIFVHTKSGGMFSFTAKVIFADAEECGNTVVPINIGFSYDEENVVIAMDSGEIHQFCFDDDFMIYPDITGGCSAEKCASCSLCK